jgi:hypothetical protein
VESLLNLVYQALKTILHKRSQAKQAPAGAAGAVDKVGRGGAFATWVPCGGGGGVHEAPMQPRPAVSSKTGAGR